MTAKVDERRRAAAFRSRVMHDKFAQPLCSVCGFAYPPIVHLHHAQPLSETDNAASDVVWLCPNCHAMVHELRRVYYSNKKVSNLAVHLSHLEYWLSDICPAQIADKLQNIAKIGTMFQK